MSTASVHIVLSDEGWILERLAKQLQSNIANVSYDLDVDPTADIQYYMTYGTWRYRVSAREIAYFAHAEPDQATQDKFFSVAKNVDYGVCHSRPYELLLRDHQIKNVVTIPPGVDLDLFQPKVKIGIVGRTYHTGRKGEHLVAAVMDIPGIEWHFTGSGWPGAALNLLDEQMPDFYRAMDYILVPSLYEGGPMSVVEALACGCKVIAPPVGWVPEYPHIEYQTGNVDDLRRVLNEVVDERSALRRSVLNRGWDTWIAGHDRLFDELANSIDKSTLKQVLLPGQQPVLKVKKPALIVHGSEKGTDKGGPSVRAPRTALRLTRHGYDASLRDDLLFDQRDYDLYHVYNLWHPRTCRQAMEHARLSGAPVVLSPIYLDLSEKRVFDHDLPKLFGRSFGRHMINDEYARLREIKARRQRRKGIKPHEPYEGFLSDVCNLIDLADHLICLSEDERRKLAAIGADISRSTVVPNPVEPTLYAQATPDLFRQTYNLTDYVLCVGRLEARKNQITLLHALRESGVPLVLVGHATNPDYDKLLRSVAGPNAIFLGRIPANSPMLASAYAGARVFCLPSWSEGAPLVALEAAAAGSNMVLSNRSSEQEYFGDRSRYCDPCDPEQMRLAVMEAYESPYTPEQRRDLSAWTSEKYSWDKHIEKTSAVYELVRAERLARPPAPKPPKIYVDLTSSAHRSGPPSGIARVEERYALELYDLMPGQVVFVLWNSHRRAFVEVSRDWFVRGKHKQLPSVDAPSYLFDDLDLSPAGRVAFERDSVLLVLGGAWIRNENYVHSLTATKRLKGLFLVAFIHDVIQAKFKQWFPDKVGDEFATNCRGLVEVSDHLIVNSQCTMRDLREFCAAEQLVTPPVDVVRFGDEIEKDTIEAEEEPQFDRLLPIVRGRPFVLCVSAIDIRKNHLMLYNIWERMLEEHGAKTPNLIMVGSKGWNIDHFLGLVEKNSVVRNVFHILNGINDASLNWLYRNCLFTVYPSLYEGWGLPVAEALNYGKVCVAARAGSVPEIAPEVTDLIDPLDFMTWYRTISGYVLNADLLAARERQVRTYKPVSWKESAANLRDLLINIRGERRPLPALQVNKTLVLDSVNVKASRVQSFKIGGWYGPEKKGSWTAGSMATLQCELLRDASGPLIVELSGQAFVHSGSPVRQIMVEVNGRSLGTLRWKGAISSDLMILSKEQADAIADQHEMRMSFHIAKPTTPASVNPQSTDKRLLGMMLSSICFRTVDQVGFGSWLDVRDAQEGGDPIVKPLLCHGSSGNRSLKLPMLINGADLPAAAAQASMLFIGFRFVVAGTKSVDVDFYADGRWLRSTTVEVGKVETRFIARPFEDLSRGTILEIGASRGTVEDLQVMEYGVFASTQHDALPAVRIGTVLDCTQSAMQADAVQSEASAIWSLGDKTRTATRKEIEQAFLGGWSRFELRGIWSSGNRAYLGMTLPAALNVPVMLAFQLQSYRANHVDLRVNGGKRHRWTLKSSATAVRYLPIDPAELKDGHAAIEFIIDGAISPAEAEGKSDTRKLGIFVKSIAVLDRSMAIATAEKSTQRTILPEALVSFGAPAPQITPSKTDLGKGNLTASTVPGKEAMLLAGWSKHEPGGVWTDGDAAMLLFRVDESMLKPNRPHVLVIEFRSFQATELRVNAGGKTWTVWPIKHKGYQTGVLRLSAEDVATGNILLLLQPVGATSPLQLGRSADDRRLGIFLSSATIMSQSRYSELENNLTAAAKRPQAPPVAAAASPAKPLTT